MRNVLLENPDSYFSLSYFIQHLVQQLHLFSSPPLSNMCSRRRFSHVPSCVQWLIKNVVVKTQWLQFYWRASCRADDSQVENGESENPAAATKERVPGTLPQINRVFLERDNRGCQRQSPVSGVVLLYRCRFPGPEWADHPTSNRRTYLAKRFPVLQVVARIGRIAPVVLPSTLTG